MSVRGVGPRCRAEGDPEVRRVLDPSPHVRDRLLRLGGESGEDRLDDARVVELLVTDMADNARSDE